MFTKERLEELLPVMAAWVSGKTIQYKTKGAVKWSDWNDKTRGPQWCNDTGYRIKPEPVMVPFEAKDIRPDWIFKREDWGLSWCKSVGIWDTGLYLVHAADIEAINFKLLQSEWLYSDDNGATWKRCEKEQG